MLYRTANNLQLYLAGSRRYDAEAGWISYTYADELVLCIHIPAQLIPHTSYIILQTQLLTRHHLTQIVQSVTHPAQRSVYTDICDLGDFFKT